MFSRACARSEAERAIHRALMKSSLTDVGNSLMDNLPRASEGRALRYHEVQFNCLSLATTEDQRQPPVMSRDGEVALRSIRYASAVFAVDTPLCPKSSFRET
jgi:hypothetical protein